jgi:transcriptional regulator with XRE-family HTH domain
MINRNRLVNLRKKYNYSQEEIAKMIGVSQQQYQRVESGYTKTPRLSTIRKLANALNTSVEYLTFDDILPIYQQLSENGKERVIEFTEKVLFEEKKQKYHK